MAYSPKTSTQTLETLERIRRLTKTQSNTAVARQLGLHKTSVSNIKRGKRRGADKRPYGIPKTTLDTLGLYRGTGKRCASCGEKREIMTQFGRCVECELLHRNKKGLLKIEKAPEAA